ncbi:MAG TPA: phosphoglycerate kinase [Candidatus Binataceae bacterium]
MAIRPVSDLVLKDKKVLLRCDFNVPLDGTTIADPSRIEASLETIGYVLAAGGAAILCSHLGRPKERSPELSLKPVAEYLSNALGHKVALAPDCIGEITGNMVSALRPGHALLLENLRFHPEEEADDRDFSHELSRGKTTYVNDAFGTAHRAHASTHGVTRFLPERAAGFLMMRELDALRFLTENPDHPYVAILGGAKVSDKIGVLKNLLSKVDTILIGGAMAYTFLKAENVPIGRSRVEDDKLELARDLIREAAAKKVSLHLPVDHVFAPAPSAEALVQTGPQIPNAMMGLDIGPQTVIDFTSAIGSAKTVVWNGPLGFFEIDRFASGTLKVGEALANSPAKSILGGGDTAAAVAGQPWTTRFSHISTGGGATLEYLEGRELPGVKALEP